jgi:hypothetical protein
MKTCNRCKCSKADEDFYKIKGGTSLHSKCKICCALINKENQQKRDKEKKNEYNKEYYQKNKDIISKQNRDTKNAYSRKYYQSNKDIIFEKEKIPYRCSI